MSSLGGNLRTIWITVRALNYTSKVFNDILNSMNTLMNTEKKMIESTKAMANEGLHFIQAGAMMVTLSVMLGSQIMNLAMKSTTGSMAMDALKTKMNEATVSLANAAYEVMKTSGVLNLLNSFLDALNRNPTLAKLVIITISFVTALVALAGIMFLWKGITKEIIALQSLLKLQMEGSVLVCKSYDSAITVSTAATMGLGQALQFVLGGFGVAFMILSSLSGPARTAASVIAMLAGAFIALGAAEIFASGPLAPYEAAIQMAAAGVALAGGLALIGQATGAFQHGTRGLPDTGLFFGHKGEVVYNPATNRPTQTGVDLAAGRGETNSYTTQITIEQINTKADIDDVDDEIRKALRKGMRNRR
jgi:hypothetical protein